MEILAENALLSSGSTEIPFRLLKWDRLHIKPISKAKL